MSTYVLCKSMIEGKRYKSVEDMQLKLDVFFATGRLTEEEYTELTSLLQSQAA